MIFILGRFGNKPWADQSVFKDEISPNLGRGRRWVNPSVPHCQIWQFVITKKHNSPQDRNFRLPSKSKQTESLSCKINVSYSKLLCRNKTKYKKRFCKITFSLTSIANLLTNYVIGKNFQKWGMIFNRKKLRINSKKFSLSKIFETWHRK